MKILWRLIGGHKSEVGDRIWGEVSGSVNQVHRLERCMPAVL